MLRLNLEGILFELQIDRYTPSDNIDDWCLVTFHLSAKDWLNYRIERQEVLTSRNVDYFAENLELLLNGEMTGPGLEFDEPDFEIEFYPRDDSLLDWKVVFWDEEGALSGNELSLTFDRKDIEALYSYLREVQAKAHQEEDDNNESTI